MRWVYECLGVNSRRFICSILPSPCISLQPEYCSSEHPFASDEVNTEREGAMERGSFCLPSRVLSSPFTCFHYNTSQLLHHCIQNIAIASARYFIERERLIRLRVLRIR
jgi:hypothetical protein